MSVVGLIVVVLFVFLVFWLQIAIEPFALFHRTVYACVFGGFFVLFFLLLFFVVVVFLLFFFFHHENTPI